jgi:CheY-like chemotaxis protein
MRLAWRVLKLKPPGLESAMKQLLLIAEDDALVSMAIEEMVSDAGFNFLVADSALEAIIKLEENSVRICALLTDIRMRGALDGWDLARHARELLPLLPIIYMTGDSSAAWNVQGVPGSVLLQKPFADAQLLTTLTTLLNKASITVPAP